MSSITVHGLDALLDRLIREKAKQENLSLNKTIKKLLAQALGVSEVPKTSHREDFADLFGVWSDEERVAFERRIEPFSVVDEGEWK